MIKGCQTLLKTFSVIFLFQIVFSAFLFISPLPVSAQSKSQQKESIEFKPQVSIPGSEFSSGASVPVGAYNSATGKMESDLLGRYMLSIINYGLAAVAIIATVVLMGGGLLWLTSRGDSGQIGKAKGLIGGSLTGMILLLCSWIILNTINPELTEFKSIDAKITEPINYEIMTCCHPTNGEINYKISSSNGKKVFASGEKEGQEASCETGASQCSSDNICAIYGDLNIYSCVPDKICCQCDWHTLGTLLNHTCLSSTTKEGCNEYCSERESLLRGPIYTNYYSSETHDCPPLGGLDGKCLKK